MSTEFKQSIMSNKDIETLKEALEISPENLTLRLMLAGKYLSAEAFDEAEEQYQRILDYESGNVRAREGLTEIYFKTKKYSAVIVIVEEMMVQNKTSQRMLVLCAKSFLRQGSVDEAQDIYEKIINSDPDFMDKELDEHLRMPTLFLEEDDDDFDDDDLPGFSDKLFMDEDFFMEKPDISFEDVGGMEELKDEIRLKIIYPLENYEVYTKYGKKPGGGILLYGPPGCGKTYLAKATAGEINVNFMSVSISDILDMWIGRSERNLNLVFEIARRNAPSILFFDEVDALGASRSDMKHSSGRHVINQFLSELDGIDMNNDGVLVLAATNAPWHLDNAFRRPGRFDRILFVPPPDDAGKVEILKIIMEDKPHSQLDYDAIVKHTKDFSGADLKAMVNLAIDEKLKKFFKTGNQDLISTSDLVKAAKKHRPSTSEWFGTARNYAVFANDSGLYDDILKYLKG